MYRFNACKYNKAGRDLYEKIVGKYKRWKLELTAMCYNLLKQVFAIV